MLECREKLNRYITGKEYTNLKLNSLLYINHFIHSCISLNRLQENGLHISILTHVYDHTLQIVSQISDRDFYKIWAILRICEKPMAGVKAFYYSITLLLCYWETSGLNKSVDVSCMQKLCRYVAYLGIKMSCLTLKLSTFACLMITDIWQILLDEYSIYLVLLAYLYFLLHHIRPNRKNHQNVSGLPLVIITWDTLNINCKITEYAHMHHLDHPHMCIKFHGYLI